MTVYSSNPISEFFIAAGKPFSYNLRRNIYIWFGILWGLPVPVVTVLIQAHFIQASGVEDPFLATFSSPVQWFFLADPLLFGLVFGVLGTIRQDKDTQVRTMLGRLHELSTLDPLTGLSNRRYFAHIFHDECARSLRRNEEMTILFLDIDHFKRINDKLGHAEGDKIIRSVATQLSEHLRETDFLARIGGEEFAIIMPHTPLAEAELVMHRLRVAVHLNHRLEVSISGGITDITEKPEEVYKRADIALYESKASGRNLVSVLTSVEMEEFA